MMHAVLPETARDFARAIIMPNLVPPVRRGSDAAAYRDRILAALPEGARFTPLMTLYLTEETDPDDLAAAAQSGLITAVKLYPAGATTNSASGVRDFDKMRPVFERMAQIGLPLCVHGEVTSPEVDIFDREAVFIDTVLDPIRRATPGLRVVMEHVTTKDGVDYVAAQGDEMGATITTHHLIINRNHILFFTTKQQGKVMIKKVGTTQINALHRLSCHCGKVELELSIYSFSAIHKALTSLSTCGNSSNS